MGREERRGRKDISGTRGGEGHEGKMEDMECKGNMDWTEQRDPRDPLEDQGELE